MFNIKRNIIFLAKIFFGMSFICCAYLSFANEANIIINNEALSSSTLTAPALIPSDSDKMKTLREKEEIETEDSILKELEKQRILDERKRFNKIFNEKESSVSSQDENTVSTPPVSNKATYWFGEKSFLSLGAGIMNYYNVTNVNSSEVPSFLGSFGGYGYRGQLIFDATFFYSVHYLKTPNQDYPNIREKVNEPGIAMAVKWSFLTGKMKPYLGLTGALMARKWSFVAKDGSKLDSPELEKLIKDVAKKQWNFSANGGIAFGADLALGEQLGLNIDIRYLVNFYTENRKTVSQILSAEELLDEQDVILASLQLKYFFN